MAVDARLFLVSQPDVNARTDFDDLSRLVTEHDPGIRVDVVEDAPPHGLGPPSEPTLTVSPAPLRWFRPPRGPLLQGALVHGSTVGVRRKLQCRIRPGATVQAARPANSTMEADSSPH
jgi:hypothetical protein